MIGSIFVKRVVPIKTSSVLGRFFFFVFKRLCWFGGKACNVTPQTRRRRRSRTKGGINCALANLHTRGYKKGLKSVNYRTLKIYFFINQLIEWVAFNPRGNYDSFLSIIFFTIGCCVPFKIKDILARNAISLLLW